MNRKELTEKLAIVSPALSDSELIPICTHVWFTGSGLMAYNDQISIRVPFKSEFVGAVPGKMLIPLMNKSRVHEFTVTEKDGVVTFKSPKGSTKLTLPMLPEKQFLFTMPKTDESAILDVNHVELLDAIKNCTRSVGTDTGRSDILGVTLMPDGRDLHVFATNNHTLSYTRIEHTTKRKLAERYILPAAFCQQYMALSKGVEDPVLEVHEKHVVFRRKGVVLFSRLIESDAPIDFHAIMRSHFDKKLRDALVAIPDGLGAALDKAIVVNSVSKDQAITRMVVESGMLTMTSRSEQGNVDDRISLKAEHADVSLKVDPRHVALGYGDFTHMVLTNRSLMMRKEMKKSGESVFMVSALGD